MTQYMELIYSMSVQEAREDNLLWKEDTRGKFNLKSYDNSLCVETKVVQKFGGSQAPLRTHSFS